MAERVTASVRAVLTRTLWLRCPHCRAESELELPPVAELYDHGAGASGRLGLDLRLRQREVFDVLHAASPGWVSRPVLFRALWDGLGNISTVSNAVKALEGSLQGTAYRLQRQRQRGLYRVVPADGHG